MITGLENSIWLYGGVILIGFLVSWLVTRGMIYVNITDMPIHRSSHTKVTPKGGGVGVIAGFATSIVLFYQLQPFIITSRPSLLLGAFMVIITISLWDDIQSLSSKTKLLAQVVSAVLVVSSGLFVSSIPLPFLGDVSLGGMGGVLTVMGIIVCFNVFNFMDGLNGLSSGGSIVATVFLIIISFLTGQKSLLLIGMALLPATLGFFVFNFPRARIFIGDVGSQFLGLLWAVIMLAGASYQHTISLYTMPLLFAAFFFDVLLTILRRMMERRNLWEAHRTHFFQILNRIGYSHAQVTKLYMGFGVLQGAGAILLQYLHPYDQIWMMLPYLAFMGGYVVWVQHKAARYMRYDNG